TRLFSGERPAPTEQQIGVLWALAMMNGAGTSGATSPNTGPVLSAILRSPATDAEHIDAIFLTTLSRYPHADERQRLLAHVELAAAWRHRGEALADIFWVLINSS